MQEYITSRHANKVKSDIAEIIKGCFQLLSIELKRKQRECKIQRELEKERQEQRNQLRNTGDL